MSSGLFGEDEVSFLEPMLEGFFDGTLEGHHWIVAEQSDVIVAAAYYAPEPYSYRMANLYFIAADPAIQGSGIGTDLLLSVENDLRAREDVIETLIVETSSTDQFSSTRNFYRTRGFTEEATIRRFYGPDDHKVVFWKLLATQVRTRNPIDRADELEE